MINLRTLGRVILAGGVVGLLVRGIMKDREASYRMRRMAKVARRMAYQVSEMGRQLMVGFKMR